jgi:hypothetical protein
MVEVQLVLQYPQQFGDFLVSKLVCVEAPMNFHLMNAQIAFFHFHLYTCILNGWFGRLQN